jgi:glycosyltransferase involved in cell wall biosynthesis
MSDYISHDEMLSIPAREVSESSKLAANPVVSVIMVTYNHETYIAQAIQGVVMQQCNFPIELLIGDDCSTDRTRAICQEYQRRYPQSIRVITADHNVGAYKNWLRICVRARGRYVAFCDGDDYWCDDYKLEKQVRMLDTHPGLNLCFSRAGICHGNCEKVVTEWHPRKEKQRYSLQDLISKRVTAITCTVCLKREVFSRLPRFIEGGAIGDWPLFILALADGNAGYIPGRLAVYRLHPNGVSQSATAEKRYGGFKAMNRLLRIHIGTRYYRCFDTSLARAYCGYAERTCVESGRYGFSAVMSSLSRCPVPPWRAGRTLIAFLMHVGLPKIYARLLAANVIKRMQP